MAVIRGNIPTRNFVKTLINYGQFLAARYSGIVENPTAGIIIIGDEILKAQVKDTNSHHVCGLLHSCGVRVKKIISNNNLDYSTFFVMSQISVVSDEIDLIAEEMVNFSKKYTYVITSGGIGPTHDDVTFAALAKAFDDSLRHHPKLVEIVRNFSSSQDVSSPAYKLAYIPASASLKFGKGQDTGPRLSYPCINLENVYVFPGSPIFLQKSFGNVYEELFATGKNFVTRELYLSASEELFADALTAVAKEFPNVTFGSYPTINHSYYSARVTMESDSEEEIGKAIAWFRESTSSDYFVNYDGDPLKDAVKKFKKFVSTDEQRPLYEATLTSLKEIYNQSSKVALCFDGSIETTVLLHLAHINNLLGEKVKLKAVHLKREKPFADVDDFIKAAVTRYELDFHTLEGSVQEAIREYSVVRPDVAILLLGLKGHEEKGGPWHELARIAEVNQVLVRVVLSEWTYKDVWNFARSLCLPYCKLYDLGYTSLGNRSDTKPNANLVKTKTVQRTEYYPAYMLNDPSLQRAGRDQHDYPQTQ